MSEEITTDIQDILDVSQELPAVEHPTGIEMTEWVFTNDKTNPAIRNLFRMFHETVFTNKLGLMHAKVKDEDIIHTLLVGIQETPEGVLTWPIAKILTEDEQNKYVAPNGVGGYD